MFLKVVPITSRGTEKLQGPGKEFCLERGRLTCPRGRREILAFIF